MTTDDFVFGDDDGVLLVPLDRGAEIAAAAAAIRDTERRQATRVREGTGLRAQLHLTDYLAARERDGTSFRAHLRTVDGEIEV